MSQPKQLFESILVLGNDSLLGKAMHFMLKRQKVDVHGISMDDIDEHGEAIISDKITNHKTSLVINTYNRGGGIGMIKEQPAEVFMQNIHKFPDILPCCHKLNVKKYINILPNCIYPEMANVPFSEDNLWSGYPEKTVAPYAMAKKISLVQTQAFSQQYNFNAINLIVTAPYGPFDHFSKEGQVIPSMILKYQEAIDQNLDRIEFWGSGLATREFIYCLDAAEAVMVAANKYNTIDPLNICTGEEIPILHLAELLSEIMQYDGQILWNRDEPEGCVRKCLSPERMKLYLNFSAKTHLKKGLKETVKAFRGESL